MRFLIWFLAGAICLGAAAAILATRENGFSARAEPAAWEEWAARKARTMALPAGTKDLANPVKESAELLVDARAHWADHCAICHANNGSGDVAMGKHMYPPAPDMRLAETQKLSDGELFYIIENGVRFTGMPAWGNGSGHGHDEQDSWKLVWFIRHLPNLTAEEIRKMEILNPKSPDEIKEEQEERDFLNGGVSNEPRKQAHEPKHEHH